MKTKIIKGTQAQILDHLKDDQLGFATDTKGVFILDGAYKRMVGKALIDTTVNKPAAGVAGRFFYDTTLGALFLDNGSEWVNASVEGSSFIHASAHITGASDEIDGDKLDIDWDPANYTPATVSEYSTSADNLTSHLSGIDTAIGGKSASNHTHAYAAASHSHAAGDLTDATATPTASKIVIADAQGKVDGWVSLSTKADVSHTHDVDEVDFSGATLSELGIVVPADGAGCTVNITVADGPGPITGLALNAGGLNYQVNDVITISGGNADATATVATINAQTGAVTGIGVTAVGTGYSTATGVATVTTSTRAWTTTAMAGLTNASTFQAALQAIHDDIAAGA